MSQLKLVDRSLLPGDAVRLVGKEELGTVVAIDATVRIRLLGKIFTRFE